MMVIDFSYELEDYLYIHVLNIWDYFSGPVKGDKHFKHLTEQTAQKRSKLGNKIKQNQHYKLLFICYNWVKILA